uniref:Uncharacterized protein n=1 Tax=Oryza punctata TaxID=4537 RepID=A0A0E0LBT4_ORYPU
MAEGGKKVMKKAMETIGTNINDLPSDLCKHMCSQRWCNIWKFVPTVHITNESIQDCHKLLDHVIMQRGDVSINTCHLEFVKYFRRDNRKANKCIFHALSVCKVKELRVNIQFQDFFLTITNQAIISGYLRKLELDSVKIINGLLHYFCKDKEDRVQIIEVSENGNYYSSFWDCGNEDCEGCYATGDHLNGSLFLPHLSCTTHLELTNDCRMTLLLNEWFLENGLWGLLRILQHSPALEKITLKLYMEPKQMVESEESYGTMEQPFVLNHLKKIKVKCQKEVMWVKKIVMILTEFGIPHQREFVSKRFQAHQSKLTIDISFYFFTKYLNYTIYISNTNDRKASL